MRTEKEKEYLLKAITSFTRKMIVVSPDFKVLAAGGPEAHENKGALVGRLCHEALFDRSAPCERCAAVQVMKTRKPCVMTVEEESYGLEKMGCLYAYPIFSGDTLEALVSMSFDVPAIGGLEEQLRRANAFLRNLILSSVDAVIAADKTGKILIFNDGAVDVTGYSKNEALSALDIRDIYPGDGARDVMRKLRSEDYGGKGKLKSLQVNILNKRGEAIPISLNAAIVYEGEQEVATIGFFHDLREENRMKRELQKTQIQLLQAEKMASLGKLAAGVAHQINNPLGGITLFSKLILEEYELEDGARQDVCRILDDAQRCRDTVKELLEFARQTRQEMRPSDISQAIGRTLFLLENQSLFQNIEIEKKFAPSLPRIPGDIQQLNHVLMNLVLNAAEAMEGKGKLTVATFLNAQADRVCIEVSDTGPGIEEQVLPHIFEPFFTTKEEGKGTGLGLSLAYSILESHKGRITARNRPEGGAVFLIELPLAKEADGDKQSGE